MRVLSEYSESDAEIEMAISAFYHRTRIFGFSAKSSAGSADALATCHKPR
jgi:hypothetical protein